MKIVVVFVMLMVCVAMPVIAAGSADDVSPLNSQSLDAVVESSRFWLSMMDAGNYAKCWSAASDSFKQKVPLNQFLTVIKSIRAPLGKMLLRQTLSVKIMPVIPGAPAGEYVEILFMTNFGNKANVVENVVVMREANGAWRMFRFNLK